MNSPNYPATSFWLAIILLMLCTKTEASPRTIELFNEVQTLVANSASGATLYRNHCAKCHGRDAFGAPSNATPALAGQRETYLLKQLIDFVELDREVPEMHRLMARPELGRLQVWRDLAAYLTSLPLNMRPQTGDGGALERGKDVYAAACAFCHGKQGQGSEETLVPALGGQYYAYLALHLRSFDADRRMNIEAMVIAYMVELSDNDLKAAADYAARLPARSID